MKFVPLIIIFFLGVLTLSVVVHEGIHTLQFGYGWQACFSPVNDPIAWVEYNQNFDTHFFGREELVEMERLPAAATIVTLLLGGFYMYKLINDGVFDG